MQRQIEKTLGIITLLLAGLVVMVFGFVYHVLPAFLLASFFSGIIAGIIYFLTLQIFNFQILWLICTVFLVVGLNLDTKAIEKKLDKTIGKNDE